MQTREIDCIVNDCVDSIAESRDPNVDACPPEIEKDGLSFLGEGMLSSRVRVTMTFSRH